MSSVIKHHTAGVFILSDGTPGKVLLHLHKKLGKWMQPGGHQESWENPLEAAIREAKEEVGIDVAPYLGTPTRLDEVAEEMPLPSYLLEELILAHGTEPEHYHIDANYVVRMPERAALPDAAESQQTGWFSSGELDALPMFDNVRILLQRELAKNPARVTTTADQEGHK
jgi:8-oxo-dGTP pyrophosphatase MutT (NUDIX family)